MKGSILAVDFQANEAVITGDDASRYKFANNEWKPPEAPARGQRVDFVVADGRATEVYVDGFTRAGGSGPHLEGTSLGNIGIVSPPGARPAVLNLGGLSPYYQAEFQKIWDSGEAYKGQWNWAAFVFGALWGMTKSLWLSVAICLVAAILTAGLAGVVYWFIYGARGTYMYYSLHVYQKQLPA